MFHSYSKYLGFSFFLVSFLFILSCGNGENDKVSTIVPVDDKGRYSNNGVPSGPVTNENAEQFVESYLDKGKTALTSLWSAVNPLSPLNYNERKKLLEDSSSSLEDIIKGTNNINETLSATKASLESQKSQINCNEEKERCDTLDEQIQKTEDNIKFTDEKIGCYLTTVGDGVLPVIKSVIGTADSYAAMAAGLTSLYGTVETLAEEGGCS